jgi:hypothetical protein
MRVAHHGNGVPRTVVAILAAWLALAVNACGSAIRQLSDGGSDAARGQDGTDAAITADTGEVDVLSDTRVGGGIADATAFIHSDASSDSDAGGDQLDGSGDVAAMAPPEADSMTCSMADGPCGQPSGFVCCAGYSLLCMGNGTCNVLGGH